jgi:hypothetical protein
MTVQYQPKEPAAVAIALKKPTFQNQFVHLKISNQAETCNVCVCVNIYNIGLNSE